MKHLFCISLGLLLCTTLCLSQKTIRVPQDSATIQAAINGASNGDTVLVSEGTYQVNLKITKKIVLGSLFIVGGDTSHISKTILDGSTPAVADSGSVIYIGAGTDSTTHITGFTIRNGKGTRMYDPSYYVYWRAGLGIYIAAGGARITHNIIRDNSLTSSDALFGGGIAAWPSPGPLSYWIIENNRIMDNHLSSSISNVSAGVEGGAINVTGNGRICYNTVYHNAVVSTGTGTAPYAGGGGIYIIGLSGSGSTNILVANNDIRGNSTNDWAGGFWAGVGPGGNNSVNVTFMNNIVSNNTAVTFGAAMIFNSGQYTLINNTIADNSGPAAFQVESFRDVLILRMLNNILWNPNASTEYRTGGGANAKYRYSDYNLVRGNISGTGNISSDPLFVPGDTLYRLSNSSPCIGAGTVSANVGGVMLYAPMTDFLHMPRPRGEGSNPDMGAVENDLPVGVNVEEISLSPTSFALKQNYPNPFNPETKIEFSIPKSSIVNVEVFDLLGHRVAVLVNEKMQAGRYSVKWNGPKMASGVYFYKLTAGSFVQTRRMLLLK